MYIPLLLFLGAAVLFYMLQGKVPQGSPQQASEPVSEPVSEPLSKPLSEQTGSQTGELTRKQRGGGCGTSMDRGNTSTSLKTLSAVGTLRSPGLREPETTCSPGSDIVIKTTDEVILPIESCLSTLKMTQAEEDQLNIVNYREHNDLNWIFRKPLQCPRKRINCLQETNSTPADRLAGEPAPIQFKTWASNCCNRGMMNIDSCNAPPGNPEGIGLACGKNVPQMSGLEKAELRHLSPVPMKTSLKGYYGGLYYYDFRYPREPISIEFMKDPEGYCCRNPTQYPCYIRESRHDLK